MPSPIDCSSTGASSGSSSPVSDGLDWRRPATGITFHATQAHNGLNREGYGGDEYGSEAGSKEDGSEEDGSEAAGSESAGSESAGSESAGSEEHDRGTTHDKVVDKAEVADEGIDGETTDGHADAEIADNRGDGHDQVEVGLLLHDDNPRQGRRFCILTLISCLFALAAVMYSASEPLPAYLAEPPQVPAWLAGLEPARPEVLVPLDGAGSVRAIVELYEPFMGDGVGLLAARSWPSGIIPGAGPEKLGGAITFFDDLGRNLTEFCGTVEMYSMPAGDTWRPSEELEGLCRPLVTLSRSAATAYVDVAYGLAGRDQGTRWLQRVMVEVLDMAHAAAGPGGAGHDLDGAADYLAANASTSDRLRRQVGPRGSWQAINSKFKGSLWKLYLSSAEAERMWVRLVPVARSFIAGTMATAAGGADPGSPHAQVAADWQQLESAMAVVHELAIAAEAGINALIMAQHRLQDLHDRLGCVRRACLVERHGDGGDEVRGRFVLAGPSVLREELLAIAGWLEARLADSDGDD